MRPRTVAGLAATLPLAAALALLQPVAANASDNCGDPYTYVLTSDITWTSQTCLANEATGPINYLRGLGDASFALTSSGRADVLSCTVNLSVWDADNNSVVTTASTDCTSAAETNGTATAQTGTAALSLPVCVLGRHYYALSGVTMTLFSGFQISSGATMSYSVYC